MLTRALSPRPSVRVAAVDDRGDVLNLYTGHARVDGTEPARPWAVYLAGTDARFRLLAFDLDAKAEGADTAAERDAATIAGLLTDAGIEHGFAVQNLELAATGLDMDLVSHGG